MKKQFFLKATVAILTISACFIFSQKTTSKQKIMNINLKTNYFILIMILLNATILKIKNTNNSL